mmetsp:Transcript_45800/g.96111  ORF Transcript_45800/g.96111 Transcript_45800/m.96111 type:complete len:84 (+) Transcript_45800:1210-1461(+)
MVDTKKSRSNYDSVTCPPVACTLLILSCASGLHLNPSLLANGIPEEEVQANSGTCDPNSEVCQGMACGEEPERKLQQCCITFA